MARPLFDGSPKLDQKTRPSALPIKFNVGKSGFNSDTLMKILSGSGVTAFFPKSTTFEAKPYLKAGRSRRDKTHFEPVVISLPKQIPEQGKTEFEEVVYCRHAKLSRISNGEWQERVIGEGDIQILRQSSTYRFLMWNKSDSNFCMNHALTFDQSFQPIGKKGWQWTAQDFSGGKGKSETFVIRFKYPSNAKAFMTAVLKNQNSQSKEEESAMEKEEDVMADEIDQDIFFTHRAKLYRFMPKEYDWKRKGFDDVGFLKKGKRLRIRLTRDDRYRTRWDEEEAY